MNASARSVQRRGGGNRFEGRSSSPPGCTLPRHAVSREGEVDFGCTTGLATNERPLGFVAPICPVLGAAANCQGPCQDTVSFLDGRAFRLISSPRVVQVLKNGF